MAMLSCTRTILITGMFPVSNRIAGKHEWWNCRILEATSYGLGNLTATVTYNNGHYESKEVITVVQEVMVYDQVKFIMDREVVLEVLLLWASAVYQEMVLKATGGCATASWNYKWFSSNIAIASVSAYGIVQPKMPGKTIIKVVSIFDSSNDDVVIEVSIPSSMVMLQDFPVETVVGGVCATPSIHPNATLEEETLVSVYGHGDTIQEDRKFGDTVFLYVALFLVFLIVVNTIVVVVLLCCLNKTEGAWVVPAGTNGLKSTLQGRQ